MGNEGNRTGTIERKQQISAYIDSHREEMIEDICRLCRINSERTDRKEGAPFGEGAARCLETALDIAKGYGFAVKNYDYYAGCADMDGSLPQNLDILAHLDVVPAGEGWKVTEPFAPRVKDGRLYGRGTADDKGPAIAALYAMRAVKELGIPLQKNVRLILGTDEECGSSDIDYYYGKEQPAPMTFSPDASYPVVNVEKGGLNGHFTAEFIPSGKLPRLVSLQAGTKINVVPGKAEAVVEGMEQSLLGQKAKEAEQETGIRFLLEQKGEFCSVTAVGTSAHASKPEDGNNAITGLLSLLVRLPFAPCEQIERLKGAVALFPHGDVNGTALGVDMEDEVSGRITVAFSMLKVDERGMDGQFDSRVPVCGNKDNVLAVDKEKMAGCGFALLNDSMRPPHHVPADSDFVRTLLKAYETYTGREGKCLSMGGATYVHNLENGVAFGAAMPETDNKMHGADEFAVIDELLTSAKIFAQVIADLCG